MISMCNNTRRPLFQALLLTVIFVAGHAVAAEQTHTDLSRINIGELSQVQSEALLFKAQAERARAQESIQGPGTTSTAPIRLTGQNSYSNSPPTNSAQSALPVVKTVFSSSRVLHATLLYASGFEVDASAGSTDLPGGYKVNSITLDSVILEHNGRRFSLGFSNRPPSFAIDSPQTSSQPLTQMLPGQPAPISQAGLGPELQQ